MGRGATLKEILIGQPEPLTVEDLAKLHEGSRTTSSVQRLRASHHRIARLIAFGYTHKEIAGLTGYTPQRVGQLAGSPAMKELVAVYVARVEEKEAENVDAYLTLKTSNMIAAERHISDHIAELDDAGELLPVKTALAISADGADRTGYGKRQTNMNLNVDFASMLEKAIKRSGKLIEGTAVPNPRNEAATRLQSSPPSPRPPESGAMVEVATSRQPHASTPLISRRA